MLWCQGGQDIGSSNRKVKSALKWTVLPQCTPVPDRRTNIMSIARRFVLRTHHALIKRCVSGQHTVPHTLWRSKVKVKYAHFYEHIYSPIRQTQREIIKRDTTKNVKNIAADILIELAQQLTNSSYTCSGMKTLHVQSSLLEIKSDTWSCIIAWKSDQ